MPTDRHLRRYFSNLPSDVCSLEEKKEYLSYKFERLKLHENFLILMIVEIQTRVAIDTHLSYVTHGLDPQDPQFTAKTAFGFMIKSLYGPYKEIIFPILSYRNTSKTLFDWV